MVVHLKIILSVLTVMVMDISIHLWQRLQDLDKDLEVYMILQSLDLEQIRLTLNKIASEAEGEFKEFIDAVVRHNAVDTYLNTFVEGLKKLYK